MQLLLNKFTRAIKAAFLGDEPGGGYYEPVPISQQKAVLTNPRLSGILPYMGYEDDNELFYNETSGENVRETTIAFALELTPQTGATQEMADILTGIYASCMPNTGVQVFCYGSNDLLPLFKRYASLRPDDDPNHDPMYRTQGRERATNIYRVLARRRIDHLMKWSRSHQSRDHNLRLRDIRVVVSVVVKAAHDDHAAIANLCTLRDAMRQTFRAAGFPARNWNADDLIGWLGELLNAHHMVAPRPKDDPIAYDPGRTIKAQIVERDTVVRVTPKAIRFGLPQDKNEIDCRFMSVLTYPKKFSIWQTADLIGHAYQDALQYPCPFLITLGVYVLDFDKTKNNAMMKASRATQNAGSKMAQVMPDIQAKKQDWDIVTKRLDEGHGMVELYHQLALFAPPEAITAAEQSAKALWRSCGFALTRDSYMQQQALMSSLPFTLTPAFRADLKDAQRITQKTTDNAVHMAPFLSEWSGAGDPVLLWFGRRGTPCAIDFFANTMGNFNVAITGVSGAGKSVTASDIVLGYLATGAKGYVIDIGHSYENLCHQVDGTFIEFKEDSDLSINPFTWIKNIRKDMKMLKPLVERMASPGVSLPHYEKSRIEEAIRTVWVEKRNAGEVTDVADFLMNRCFEADGITPDKRARDLGVQLRPFTRDGMYGNFFSGPANINMDGDFVVLELEDLKSSPDLQTVVMYVMMYKITDDMYQNRSRRKFANTDEGWALFDDTEESADFIEEGYRRARKYQGCFMSATQGVRDYYKSKAAEAAWANADWKIFLRQDPEQLEILEKEGKLVLSPAIKRMVTSLRTEAGMYSEAVIRSPLGTGLVRIIIDPYSLLLSSSNHRDFTAVRAKKELGFSTADAISEVLKERGINV